MPARVRKPQRIVQHIAVPIQALRVAGVWDERVRLDETAAAVVAPARNIVVQLDVRLMALARVAICGL